MPIALAHSLVVLVVVFFRSLILYDILWNIHFHFIWAASQWAISFSGSPPTVQLFVMIDIVFLLSEINMMMMMACLKWSISVLTNSGFYWKSWGSSIQTIKLITFIHHSTAVARLKYKQRATTTTITHATMSPVTRERRLYTVNCTTRRIYIKIFCVSFAKYIGHHRAIANITLWRVSISGSTALLLR